MKDLELVLNHFGQSFLISGAPEKINLEWGEKLKKEVGLGDFWGGYFNQVKIEDVRELKAWHSQKSQSRGRYALLASSYFTREAQTALLKITEEPNTDTVIILATRNQNDLLDTLRSRLQLVIADDEEKSLAKAKKFAGVTPTERLSKQKSFVDLEADNHRALVADLIDDLKRLAEPGQIETIKILTKAEKFIGVTGLSAKNTYEYLAIALPVWTK